MVKKKLGPLFFFILGRGGGTKKEANQKKTRLTTVWERVASVATGALQKRPRQQGADGHRAEPGEEPRAAEAARGDVGDTWAGG